MNIKLPEIHVERQLSRANLIIGTFLLILALSFILVPLTFPPNTVHLGDNGTTIPGEKRNITSKMPIPQRWLYEYGDATCHQKESRSWHLNGNQMPLCSRCTAIYLGLAIGTLIMAFYRFEIPLWAVFLFLLPMAIDGTGQTILGLWESTNIIRTITGLLAGGITGMMLGFAVNEASG